VTGVLCRSQGRLAGMVAEFTRGVVLRALSSCNWSRTRAARDLGVSRRTLYELARRLGIALRPRGSGRPRTRRIA
jgi:transcriptional regulator of acetoin/glycerol metabolism